MVCFGFIIILGALPLSFATCPSLIIDNGEVNYTLYQPTPDGSYPTGTVVFFTCNEGYMLTGAASITCQESETWTGETPTCNEVTCPSLSLGNGAVTYDTSSLNEGYPVDTEASFTCNTGFSLSGPSTTSCQNSGDWNPQAPTCNPVTCPAFPTLENGVIIYYGTEVNGQYPYLTGVIFLCDYPLALSGPETDFCLSTSNWQHQPRTCNQVTCPALPDLTNGTITYQWIPRFGVNDIEWQINGTYLRGTSAELDCDIRYIISGSSRRECTSAGTWSGQATCRPKACQPLPNLENGRISYIWTYDDHAIDWQMNIDQYGTYIFGVTANYTCNTGYKISGASIRDCWGDEIWRPMPAPICKPKICPAFRDDKYPGSYQPTISYDQAPLDDGYPIGTVATFTCVDNDEYYLWEYSRNISTCHLYNTSGRVGWTGLDPYCARRKCYGRDLSISNGTVILDRPRRNTHLDIDPEDWTYTLGTTATWTCNAGYVLIWSGARTTTCRRATLSGAWDYERKPRCETGCEAISMENGRITFDQDPLGDGYPIGTVLNATCNDGYYLSYSSDNVQYYSDNCTLGTLGRGVWHHHPLTGLIECWLVRSCPALSLDNGQLTYQQDPVNGEYVAGSTVTFSCNDGYSASGPTTRTCRRSGNWNGTAQSCNSQSEAESSNGGGGGGGGCFPSMAKVQLKNGNFVTISELKIRDCVQTVSSFGLLTYSEVKIFLKKQPDVIMEYKSITTSANTTINLSNDHLIFTRKYYNDKFQPIYADELSVADEVLIRKNDDDELTPAMIINVTTLLMAGAYVPVTKEGNLMVDDVLASCYASADHGLSHLAMTPFQHFPDIINLIFGEDYGFQVSATIAEQLSTWLLPHGQLWN